MKKLIVMLMMALVCCVSINAQSYSRSGDTFTATAKERTAAAKPTKTKFTWTDSRNKSYPIYVSANGSCFVIKTSARTGKEYRNYLGKEISIEICKELGIEYKGKK